MAKSPNRVKAGKKAWAKLSASEQKRRISALKGGSKTTKVVRTTTTKKSRASGGGRTAKKKSRKRSNGQSLASWATSVGAWAVALGAPLAMSYRRTQLVTDPWNKAEQFTYGMVQAYTGYDIPHGTWKPKTAIGVPSLVGGMLIKKAGSYLIKTCPIKGLIPRLG